MGNCAGKAPVAFFAPSALSIYSLAHLPTVGQVGHAPLAMALPAIVDTPATTTASVGFSLWVWVWFGGAALLAVYFVVAYIRCRRDFCTSLPVENPFALQWLAEHQGRRPITIRQSSSVLAPLTYGILRPVILMPAKTDWAECEALRYVLTHEYVHIRRFDGIVKFF